MQLERFANLILHLVCRIYTLEPQKNENNTARVGTCRVAMPFLCSEAGAFMVSTTIMEHGDCLAVGIIEEEIDLLTCSSKAS